MNRSDSEALAIGAVEDGTVVFYNPTTDHHVQMLAALRDQFDRVDPVPAHVVTDAHALGDLRDQVRIPQYSAFVKEFLGDNTAKEDQP